MFKKIYIEITNACNLRCKFCPETVRKKEFMDIKNFEEVIKKIHKYTNLVCLHVKGEPFLHNDLENMFKILESYNLMTNITTNGTLINDKLDILKKSKIVRQINFSIHSIMQNDGIDKNKYLQDIFKCVEELDNVIISYRLWNVKDIKENDVNSEVIEALEEYYSVSELKRKLKKNNFIKLRKNIFINQDTEFIWPNKNNKKIIDSGRCLALKDQIAILVDGTVVPCCLDNDGDIPLGNIFFEELEDILNKDKAVTMKNNFSNKIITCELCRTCGFLKRLEEKRT